MKKSTDVVWEKCIVLSSGMVKANLTDNLQHYPTSDLWVESVYGRVSWAMMGSDRLAEVE